MSLFSFIPKLFNISTSTSTTNNNIVGSSITNNTLSQQAMVQAASFYSSSFHRNQVSLSKFISIGNEGNCLWLMEEAGDNIKYFKLTNNKEGNKYYRITKTELTELELITLGLK